ncbi:type IV secretion protein Rhs [Prevotella intermedia]|uniref:Type IV secretion protein Rhs n=1 Tax=Prevotella intermedia TaxID=28131 RepID=A0AAJ3VB78_PREIN|nr:phage baseplate assembly protein V [Prevotella intermedia]ATV39076.1 type IV secretion protein Rhs [Prevotella intermedia]PIK17414.1 type IV secretion protein Rhs [Prevotella intermedia]
MSIPQTSITVSIGDTRLPSLKSLRLEQGIGCHHRFDLCIDLEAGGNRYVHNIGSSSEWLGQPITVHSSDQPIFLGVVTNVRLHREGSDFGFILISGYSATYRMETAPGCFSWLEQPIGEVVRSLCGQANVQLRLNPAYGKKLDYICQYDESDFDFVRRLALQYQEWMYYDGTSLVFGRPKDSSEPVELEYGTTLSSLEIGLQTLARPEQVFTYHSSSDREMDQPTPDLAYGHDQLSGKAFRASLGMYGRPARQHALPRIHTESELIKYMRRKQAADTAETHYVTAESHVPELRVGSVVRLYSSFLERVGQLTRESLGDFIITEIVHEVGEGSYYRNRFKAIPSTVEALPSPRVPMPVAETQMATVTSNADPNGNGRVQVRMNWQQGDMHTGWVRVMTPDAGKSGDVSSNRGFVFIPEVGDQVLLGFRHGDPARPYVMGSLFNGETGKGGFESNHRKSLTTRTGHTIELNDSFSSLGITIKDILGNSIHIDSVGNDIVINAKRNVTINAGETFTVNCKNANILAEESINMNAEQDITSVSGESTSIQAGESLTEIAADSYVLSANDANVQVTEEHNLQASTISETAEKINIDSTMEDLDLSSPKKVNIQSSEKVNLF